MTIGERIRRRREELGLSVDDVAKRLCKHRATIYRYESNEIEKLPTGILEPLAVVLQTSPAYLMGWEEQAPHTGTPAPLVTDDVVTMPVIGEVAAGYGNLAYENWQGDSIEIPRSYLHGRELSDYFVLRVVGDSMYPDYQDGDHVLVLRQSTMDRSGQIGVIIYGDEASTLKRIEYVEGENWLTMRPVNPQYPPVTIRDEALEHCTVLGVAKMVIRDLEQ